jgi:ATP-binding cassette, subfamily G (WHITE), member 2, SNQ2
VPCFSFSLAQVIWDSFDDLLLLTRGGKVAYMGEMGPKSQKVISYFSQLASSSMPANANPADYVIASVSSVTPDEAQSSFTNSKEHAELAAKLKDENTMNEQDKQVAEDLMKKSKLELGKRKSALRELGILTKRQLITQWRNPAYSITRIFCSVFLAVYFGILFGADKSTIEGAVLTIGSTFFLVFVLVVPMQAAVVPLIADRAVLYREATSGLYSRWSYAVASLLADIPFHVLNCLLMFVGFYFLCGKLTQRLLILACKMMRPLMPFYSCH